MEVVFFKTLNVKLFNILI